MFYARTLGAKVAPAPGFLAAGRHSDVCAALDMSASGGDLDANLEVLKLLVQRRPALPGRGDGGRRTADHRRCTAVPRVTAAGGGEREGDAGQREQQRGQGDASVAQPRPDLARTAVASELTVRGGREVAHVAAI